METTKHEDRKTWNGLYADAAAFTDNDGKVRMTVIIKMGLY